MGYGHWFTATVVLLEQLQVVPPWTWEGEADVMELTVQPAGWALPGKKWWVGTMKNCDFSKKIMV